VEAHVSGDDNRPVLAGLVALIGVSVAVGLVAAAAVVGVTHMFGLTGGHAAVAGDAGATLYLPMPQKTSSPNGPTITLGSEPSQSTSNTSSPTIHKPKKRISLQSGQTTVSPMGRIDLTGIYPGGEGAVLNVQKFQNGSWQDFYSVSATVTNGTFSTYIQTGIPGPNRFRVIDSDTHLSSNPVRVVVR
jgi:hypothetical protein